MRSRRNPSSRIGRRPTTTRDRIAAVGIDLFATRGFDDTSVDDIAEAAGIARRTFFRYFPSKNAVPWGDFDAHLSEMRTMLSELPGDIPVLDGLTSALLAFNTFPPEVAAGHRRRMRLIFEVPALQAYSVVMYDGWRRVIAEYVARRLHVGPTDQLPKTVGYLLLGVALAAYETWLADDESDLLDLLGQGSRLLYTSLSDIDAPILNGAPHDA
ncbi:mycofactocin system transcriptional regulator [Rhodococcus sp. SGAir0479]|uniref:mycofactocin system transcriptional regulator n=1 Tax=Rhodococcus sp. SGAir0479 TaxID=2567884 RepID=UPI0010CD336D|nr:mycofactocin system transcriptional regulator [Rhodococcus sp. SGAir0479]QCQ92224.1 mycofactocin system transcriptional regulator [Rhodococcus sp. SGAir0479]